MRIFKNKISYQVEYYQKLPNFKLNFDDSFLVCAMCGRAPNASAHHADTNCQFGALFCFNTGRSQAQRKISGK